MSYATHPLLPIAVAAFSDKKHDLGGPQFRDLLWGRLSRVFSLLQNPSSNIHHKIEDEQQTSKTMPFFCRPKFYEKPAAKRYNWLEGYLVENMRALE
jgi:hypothetical protein